MRPEPLAFSPWVRSALAESGLHVVVTGGGGWLGQATLEMLEHCFADDMHHRVHAFGARAHPMVLRSGRTLACHALTDLATLASRPCLILHYAFMPRSQVAHMPLAEYIAQNDAIGSLLAAQALRLNAEGIFIPSSGAVYRPDRSIDDNIGRNPYGVLKTRDERRFLDLAQRTRVAIMRVFNLAGPFINNPAYALASILSDIENGGPIRLSADKPVWRSYVHIRDMIDLAVALLLAHEPPPAAPFDTAGEIAIEVGDLARRAAALTGSAGISIERPALSGAPDRYVGDAAAMAALMNRHRIPPRPLDAQILDTARYMKEALCP